MFPLFFFSRTAGLPHLTGPLPPISRPPPPSASRTDSSSETRPLLVASNTPSPSTPSGDAASRPPTAPAQTAASAAAAAAADPLEAARSHVHSKHLPRQSGGQPHSLNGHHHPHPAPPAGGDQLTSSVAPAPDAPPSTTSTSAQNQTDQGLQQNPLYASNEDERRAGHHEAGSNYDSVAGLGRVSMGPSKRNMVRS